MWPSVSIWIKPEQTFGELINLPPEVINKKTNLILLVIAFSQAFQALIIKMGEITLWKFTVALFIWVMAFIGAKYILPYFLVWICKLFKGRADFKQTRIVVAYALLPFVFNGILTLIYTIDMFLLKNIDLIVINPITNYIVTFLSIRFYVYGLSIINKFTYLYGFISIAIFISIGEVIKLILPYS